MFGKQYFNPLCTHSLFTNIEGTTNAIDLSAITHIDADDEASESLSHRSYGSDNQTAPQEFSRQEKCDTELSCNENDVNDDMELQHKEVEMDVQEEIDTEERVHTSINRVRSESGDAHENWEKMYDDAEQSYYYHCALTGQSCWEEDMYVYF